METPKGKPPNARETALFSGSASGIISQPGQWPFSKNAKARREALEEFIRADVGREFAEELKRGDAKNLAEVRRQINREMRRRLGNLI